jgi:uncharacterized lipoprotein YajG
MASESTLYKRRMKTIMNFSMFKKEFVFLIACLMVLASCSKKNDNPAVTPPPTPQPQPQPTLQRKQMLYINF